MGWKSADKGAGVAWIWMRESPDEEVPDDIGKALEGVRNGKEK